MIIDHRQVAEMQIAMAERVGHAGRFERVNWSTSTGVRTALFVFVSGQLIKFDTLVMILVSASTVVPIVGRDTEIEQLADPVSQDHLQAAISRAAGTAARASRS